MAWSLSTVFVGASGDGPPPRFDHVAPQTAGVANPLIRAQALVGQEGFM
jgi:hypothetical protein